MSRPLGALVDRLAELGLLAAPMPPVAVGVDRVTHDSRRVAPGSLFVALPGAHADGHDHAPAAVAAGAVALLVARPLPPLGVPQVLVRAPRPALAVAAAWIAGDPAVRLGIVGITGTDGKTTTAWLIRSVLVACGLPTGLLGTIDTVVGGRSLGNPERTTTPEAPELQERLAAMEAAGDRWAVVEATSHGLAQDRVGAIPWDVAVHTNITSEHLEFHGTLAAYRAAKRRLFTWDDPAIASVRKPWGRHAVVNLDDDAAPMLTNAARGAGATIHGYGMSAAAPIAALDVAAEGAGHRVRVRTPRWEAPVDIRLPGRFNIANALAAIATGEALALDPAGIRAGIAALAAVPGRMERIDAGQPFLVVVDFAHTAASLAKVLDELAPVAERAGGGLIACFGSAGDRDRTKRPEMGAVAAARCRSVVLTDEDARSEDPASILAEIATGCASVGLHPGPRLRLVPDRAEGIATSIALAGPGDVVLIAGKGHEASIERGGVRHPWSEEGAVRDALARRGWADGSGSAPVG
ncbi:MAG: UDP-N-acetylmuramoyl-L-alanyl-D-glutamate--2,6-diaminopimelate ligase [Chloroflexota bacterium]